MARNFYFPLTFYGKKKLCAAFAKAVSVTHFSMLKRHFPQLKHCRKCTIFRTSFIKSFYITYRKITKEYRISCKDFQVNLKDNENVDKTLYKLMRSDFSIIPSNNLK